MSAHHENCDVNDCRPRSKETRKHWQVRAYNAAAAQFHDDDVKWKMFEAGWQAAMNSKPLKQND